MILGDKVSPGMGPKKKLFTMKVTKAERLKWQKVARLSGTSVAGVVRESLNKQYNRFQEMGSL